MPSTTMPRTSTVANTGRLTLTLAKACMAALLDGGPKELRLLRAGDRRRDADAVAETRDQRRDHAVAGGEARYHGERVAVAQAQRDQAFLGAAVGDDVDAVG